MATPARIILIFACACLVDSRLLRGRFNKQQTSPADHHINEVKSEDPDAVIFPDDEEPIVFERANKNVDAAEVDKHGDDKDSTDIDSEVKNVLQPLISSVIPEKEIKDVFTYPIELEDIAAGNGKIGDVKEPVIDTTEDKLVPNEPLPDADNNIQENKTIEGEAEELNDTIARYNDIVPDLSSRLGVAGNYMLVPVAANVQGYQPIQTNQNANPMSAMQVSLPFQTQVPNELNTNSINPQHVANVGSNSNVNYTPYVNYPMQTANVAPNVGNDVQYVTPNIGSNVLYAPNTGSNIVPQYIAPNYGNNNQANVQVNGNNYVPVSVPNTYLINGQLYAAVTVPSNQVPSSLYYVNPQVSSYQVPNDVPLYKLVSMSDGGSQAVNGNTQYVPNNQNV